jgi:hypothetical protein
MDASARRDSLNQLGHELKLQHVNNVTDSSVITIGSAAEAFNQRRIAKLSTMPAVATSVTCKIQIKRLPTAVMIGIP